MDAETLKTSLEDFQEWRPHPRQEDFLQAPYDIFEVLYGGALGGGKTDVLIVAPIVLKTKKSGKQLYEHPDFIGIIFRRTFPELEKKIIPRAKQIYESLGARYNETKKVFTFPSGAKIFLGHMEKEKDVLQHDTNEYQYVGIDQAEQFTEFQLRYISSRIRSSNPDLPAIYRMTANPGGESHIYLRDRFVKPAISGNVVLIDKVTKLKRLYIPARLTDNPHLMNNDPDYINRLMLLPEAEREAKMNGDWFTFSGAVFQELRITHNPGEPENALHTIAPFPIPSYWPKILAIDWGWSANTFAIWGAISPDERCYIYRTYKSKKSTIRQWGSDLARISQFDGKITRVTLDPSAWQQRGYELTIAEEFQKASGFIPEKADNDRHSGISLIHEFLRFNPKPPKKLPATGFSMEIANSILRMQGTKAYDEYLDMFKPEAPETNLPKLQFFYPGTEDILSALQSCQYKERDKEDYEEFDGDDPVDCTRYLLKASKVYLEEARNRQKYLQLEADIHKQLEESGDQTSFYMRMNYLDKVIKEVKTKPVKRYASGRF
jgi:hypothetical protein